MPPLSSEAEDPKQFLEFAFEQANVGIALLASDGKFLRANPKLCRILGYDKAELLGKTLLDFVYSGELDVGKELETSFQTGNLAPGATEHRFLTKSGSIVWLKVETSQLPTTKKQSSLFCSYIHDITPAKHNEQALQERIKELRCLYEVAGLLSGSETPLPETLQAVADALPSGWQYPECAAVRITWEGHSFESKSFRPCPRTLSSPILGKEEQEGTLEVVYLEERPEADEGPFLSEEKQLIDHVAYKLGAFLEKRQKETAIRLSEQFLRAIVSCSPIALFSVDLEGRVSSWNESAQRIFGWTEEEVIGKPLPIVPSNNLKEFEQLRALVKTQGGFQDKELIRQKKDGTLFPIALSVAPIFNNEKKMVGILAAAADITAKKLAEEENEDLQARLAQAHRMESIGRLAGGVAHDFNNILQALVGYANLLLDMLPPDEEAHDLANEITRGVRRAINLTRQLLAFARRQTVEPQVMDLNANIESLFGLLKGLAGDKVELRWKPAKAVWPVRIDPSQLNQILTNLCINAKEASEQGGKIEIATSNREVSEAEARPVPGLKPGDYGVVRVSDQGRGMSEYVLQKIFEPFFTTKKLGTGTGLGLATVYGIVKQNEGFILAESELGKGSTFTVYLPRYQGSPKQPVADKSSEMTPTGTGECILLVDDEPSIVKLGQRFLKGLGYRVLPATSPSRALELAKEHGQEIDLLLTDVVMPEMNGPELAEQLSSVIPQTKVLYMSGYTADLIADRGILQEGIHFLEKPFSFPILAQKIRSVLSPPPGSVSE